MQPTPGKAVFVRALVILNFDINCHFYTRHISVQNIGYRSSWSVIIGIHFLSVLINSWAVTVTGGKNRYATKNNCECSTILI